MVDASLRPRPTFSTFLQTDSNAGGDGLTYYDYQRLLRSQKVAILQEKRAISYVPGFKKVEGPTSRKIFQLRPTRSPAAPCSVSTSYRQVAFTKVHTDTAAVSDRNTNESQQLKKSQKHLHNGKNSTSVTEKETVHAYTERFANIPKPQRLIKSATARISQHNTWSGPLPCQEVQCPKTAGSKKDVEINTDQMEIQGSGETDTGPGN